MASRDERVCFLFSSRVLHSCDPYKSIGLTVAEYSWLVALTVGPQVAVASLARLRDALCPFLATWAMCSFQVMPGSSHTPRSFTVVLLSILWSLMVMLFARSSRAVRRFLVKWISWYFSGANLTLYRSAYLSYS